MSNPVSSKPVDITDPTLSNFHNQRIISFSGTTKQIDEFTPTLRNSVSEIAQFSGAVRDKGWAYQNEAETPPEQAKLIEQKEAFLKQYDNFKQVHEKSALLAVNILSTITFLTPVPRTWSQEQSFQTDSPELYQQTKRSEEICLGHIATLNKSLSQINSLKDRLLESINNSDLTWSLQRFCAIVDNNGKPLSLYTRAGLTVSPYIFTPVIPKPTTTPVTTNNQTNTNNQSSEATSDKKPDQIQTTNTNTNENAKSSEKSEQTQSSSDASTIEEEKIELNNDLTQTIPTSDAEETKTVPKRDQIQSSSRSNSTEKAKNTSQSSHSKEVKPEDSAKPNQTSSKHHSRKEKTRNDSLTKK